jgi:hypothetical protein
MYLDSGLGSMAIQVIVAAIAAIGSLCFATKARIKGLFSRRHEVEEREDQIESDK